ncbi:MAG: D-alanine--D-alanine ligase [Pseudomonadota bacterium]|jgi:D-alanine-D-alanine ligase
MADFGRVAVLMGGISAEREVSLMSGRAVLAALEAAGVEAFAFDPAQRSICDLRGERADRAFIALHGRQGEDGTVQGALEMLGIPYTGSGVAASALAMDKMRTKMVWIAGGIPTPTWEAVGPGVDADALCARLGLPLVIKPAREGSTLGLTRVERAADVAAACDRALAHDRLVIAESFIAGREYTAGFVGEEPLPLVRIEAPGGNYDYHSKYFSDETRYHCPCGLPPEREREIQAITMRAAALLGCEGWGRADLIVREDGSVQFLEMNTSPGMTGHSLVPMAAREAGYDFGRLVLRILEGARAR